MDDMGRGSDGRNGLRTRWVQSGKARTGTTGQGPED